MKLCANCGATLQDNAVFCIACNCREFRPYVMPDLDAPEPDKPHIEYDQYGRPIGQEYQQPEYEQPHFTEGFSDGFSDSFHDPFSDSYSESANHPQYIEQYTPQTQQQYGQPQIQQYQPQYEQPQAQQYQPQYGQPQAQQYQPQYEQPQAQQYQPQYEQQPQAQQYQPQYGQPQAQQYQPQYEQQPQAQQYQPQAQQYQQQSEQPQAQQYEQPKVKNKQAETIQQEPPKPVFDSKNFVFEKKEEPEKTEEAKKMPKNLKEIIAELRDTRDFTGNYNAQDFAAHKVQCILASLGITFWVPYVSCKNSQSSRFYANQGFLTLILEIVFGLIFSLFANIISIGFVENTFDGYRLSLAGWIVGLIVAAIVFAIPLFVIVTSIMNIRAGKIKEIPFLGKLRILP